MPAQQGSAHFNDLARRWHDLADRRVAHFAELYHSGRWRHYYRSEEQFAERMLEANWVLYTGYRFGWTASQVGISLALVGVLVVITQGGLVRVVVPKIGERVTINVGFSVAAACMVGLAFAPQAWMIYAIIVPYVLGWGLTAPAVQSLITRQVPPNEQGILQGAISSAQTVTGIIGPPVAGTVFGYFIGQNAPIHLPGIAFLVGALLFVIGLIVAWRGVHAPPPAKRPD